MSSKPVMVNGKEVLIPETLMVRLGHHEGKHLNENQRIELVKEIGWLAVKPTPDPLGPAVH
jgi:hypothetical protein